MSNARKAVELLDEMKTMLGHDWVVQHLQGLEIDHDLDGEPVIARTTFGRVKLDTDGLVFLDVTFDAYAAAGHGLN